MKEAAKKLCDRIPKVNCIPGCTKCCERVGKMKVHLDELEPLFETSARLGAVPPTGQLCSYNIGGCFACSVYDVRPLICRLCGAIEKKDYSDPKYDWQRWMQCPLGCTADKPLTQREAQDIMDEAVIALGPLISFDQIWKQRSECVCQT